MDGKRITQDAEVLSSLKSYLTDPSGLDGTEPDFFIVISNFDDTRLQGTNSIFVQVLQRISMLQESLYNSTLSHSTLFLLTRFMSSTKATRRKPGSKIQGFRETIRDFSSFKEPIRIVVGENLGIEYELEMEKGFRKLPNKESYPENVYTELINQTISSGNNFTANCLELLKNRFANPEEIYSEYFNSEIKNSQVLKQLYTSISGMEKNEINIALEAAIDKLEESVRPQEFPVMLEIQRHMKDKNITLISQLPNTAFGKVNFFQNFHNLNSHKIGLLELAFNLTMPQFLATPVVGYGFDLTQDSVLPISPFIVDKLRSSPIGYLTSDFLECRRFENPKIVDFGLVSENLTQYLKLRYELLGFKDQTAFPDQIPFSGFVKSGFNLRPQDGSDSMGLLSVIREIRTMECNLNNIYELSDDFVDSINYLKPLDQSNKESVKEWQGFFNEYGTHVVTQGFGGGYMKGSLSQIMNSTSRINKTLEQVLNFVNQSLTERPTYGFFGGDKDERLKYALDLDEIVREELLRIWNKSLNFDPVLLQYELKLIPIAFYVKQVNYDVGLEVENTARLLMSGNLKYKKVRKSTQRFTNFTTISSIVIVTTTTTTSSPSTTIANSFIEFEQQEITTSSSNPNSSEIDISAQKSLDLNPEKNENVEIKYREYTRNSVGQGYHMLKDIVLKEGPFSYDFIIANRIVTRLEQFCKLVRAKRFESLQTYVDNRLRVAFGIQDIPPKVISQYKGRTLKGNFVIRDVGNETFYSDIEVWTSKTSFKNPNTLIPQESFQLELKSLPIFGFWSDLNCTNRQKWREFFDTFGTHYVKSTYRGYSDKGKSNFGENLQYNCEQCIDPKYSIGDLLTVAKQKWNDIPTCPSFNPMTGYKGFLKSTFEFVSYTDFVKGSIPLLLSMNEAMYQLMVNGCSC